MLKLFYLEGLFCIRTRGKGHIQINMFMLMLCCYVISFFASKAFCDWKCRFVHISSKMCSSSYDNTAYIAKQLSEDI